jgi:glycine cleavage system aminomethyltransferase T
VQGKLGYDVDISTRDIFIIQVAGPAALQVLEKTTGESLRDVEFLQARPTKIKGIDYDIEVSRIGMVGNLAYELRGPIEAGPAVYDLVYQIGKEYNIKRLGWRTYIVNHVEGGFPQMNCIFLVSSLADKEFMNSPMSSIVIKPGMTGSVDPTDMRARFRTPAEVDWSWMAKFNHEFIGREAVEAEAKNPKRKIVTLKWNPDDAIDIYASLFEKGDAYKVIELPFGQQQPSSGHADHVTKNGKQIGVSAGTTYSYYYREIISHCSIDIDQAKEGNEVVVHWGDYGKRIKEVRTTVARYPYLDLPRNQDYDINSVPQPSTK